MKLKKTLWLLSEGSCWRMGLVRSPPSHSETPRRGGRGGICNGQILTLIKIMICVRTLEASLLCQWAQLTYKPNMGLRRRPLAHRPKKKGSGLAWAHIWSDITHAGPLLNWSCVTLRNAKTLTGRLSEALLLLRCLQLDNTISSIRGSSYVARSSPYSKCYYTPISMRVVMDRGCISEWWAQ